MRGAGQLGVGTEVEMVGDVANRMEKLEAAIRDKPECPGSLGYGMAYSISRYSIDLLYIYMQ